MAAVAIFAILFIAVGATLGVIIPQQIREGSQWPDIFENSTIVLFGDGQGEEENNNGAAAEW
jgi:hypothetical protein